MPTLVLVRHGESQWNLENRFTGWVDVGLSDKGRKEAWQAGEKLRGYQFDKAFTSVLKRAIDTLKIIIEVNGWTDLPITYNQALNERHYGDLQGLNKAETAQKFGDAQVKLWRRSYAVRPPNGESLADTAARVLPYYEQHILPELEAGRNILVVAHGNSLRALVMRLDNLSEQVVIELNIPTGVPLQYQFDMQGRPLEHQYL
ncbi:MAG: 2,3-bisphosphoglycerate-dependent phosphoglycerate mutase [Anaerolineae bacterium]|nr:2,3-bisphosphoglycerate-dependent phosphoglycerate mutase [Anaerolineae bacterium]